jgi:hypothetical protein
MALTTPRNNLFWVLNVLRLRRSTCLFTNLRTSTCHVVTSIVTNVHDNCKAPNLTMCGQHVAQPTTGAPTVGTAIHICRNITSELNPAVVKQIVIDNKGHSFINPA